LVIDSLEARKFYPSGLAIMLSNAERSPDVSAHEAELSRIASDARTLIPGTSQQNRRVNRQGTRPREGSLSARPFLFSSSAAWIFLDFAVAFSAASFIHLVHGKSFVVIQTDYDWCLAALPFAFLVLVFAQISGLYRKKANPSLFLDASRILMAVIPAALGILGLKGLWGIDHLPSHLIAREVVLTGAAMFLGRALWRRRRDQLFQRDIALRNFLVVGADEIGQNVRSYLTSLRYSGYRFQGFVAMCEPSDDPLTVNDDEIVGEIHDVIEIARSRFIDEIIFSRRPATPGVLSRVLHQAQTLGISIRLIPGLTETLVDRTDVEYVGDLPTIAVYQAMQRPVSLLVKRVIDVTLATFGCVVLLPLFAVIAVLIKLQSPGPVLYVSKRVGHKGRIFTCFKFRTMVDNAAAMQQQLAHMNERDRVTFKISKDPRVTTLGAVLRKYSLDELPQLWNVLRGDMSLVGPRPPLDTEVAQYDPAHLRRLDAVPGITGLWQVEARQDPSFEKFVVLDSKYINNWSLQLDLRIMLRTISAVIRGTGS
jgi:exopolysaccharide biosynthesis polyprenyl glycosylphosphotransferase